MNKQDSGIIGLLRQHWVGVAVLLLIYDAIAVNVSFFSALWVRFDCRFSMIPARYLSAWLHFTPIYTVFCLIVFWMLKLYMSMWRFASFSELLRITFASLLMSVLHIILINADRKSVV